MSLTFYGIRSLYEKVVNALGGKTSPTCSILYYHDVKFNIRRFVRQLDLIVKTVKPIAADNEQQLENGEKYCIITFCDGFQCFYEVAVSELTKRNIPATVFIPTAYIGCCPGWHNDGDHETLSECLIMMENQIKSLPSQLIKIGSHGVSHRNICRMNEQHAKMEVYESKRFLESLTKKEVNQFFPPYGVQNHLILNLAREAGYKQVFYSIPDFEYKKSNIFMRWAVSADPTDWYLEIKLKCLGAYSWLPYAISKKNKIFFYFRRLVFN